MMNFGESNLYLGFMAHQHDLDNIAKQIVTEYRNGHTSVTLSRAGLSLSETDLQYIESQVNKMLS